MQQNCCCAKQGGSLSRWSRTASKGKDRIRTKSHRWADWRGACLGHILVPWNPRNFGSFGDSRNISSHSSSRICVRDVSGAVLFDEDRTNKVTWQVGHGNRPRRTGWLCAYGMAILLAILETCDFTHACVLPKNRIGAGERKDCRHAV